MLIWKCNDISNSNFKSIIVFYKILTFKRILRTLKIVNNLNLNFL